jgi:hypothetical protein
MTVSEQREGNRSAQEKDAMTGLCTECALRHHDFSEVKGGTMGDSDFSDPPLPAAWIDGRRHAFQLALGSRAVCAECGKTVVGFYIPAE